MKRNIFYNGVLLLSFLGLQAQTKIGSDILGNQPWAQSGRSVSLSADGSTVAIGAHLNNDNGYFAGQGRIFKKISGSWDQIGQNINGGITEMLGLSNAISANGNIVAFGVPFYDAGFPDTGQVKIYELRTGNWEQIGADINGKSQEESAGYSVSLSSDGKIVAVGAPYSSLYKKQSGVVRVYQNIAGNWTQIGNDIGEGDNDSGNVEYDRFGYSVSISSDGSIVAIGAPQKSGNINYPGKVVVYQYIDGVWTQIGSTIFGKIPGELSGQSVSLSSDGSTLAIGAPLNSGEIGSVRMYKNTGGIWSQIGSDINGEYGGGQSGYSVSISADGSIVAVGEPLAGSGQTRIFKNNLGNWEKIAKIQGDFASDASGVSVSLSSNASSIAIGAPQNSQNGDYAGKVSVYDLSAILSTDQFIMERTSVYPNPVNNELYIQLKEDLDLQQVNIYSVLGQLIQTAKSNQINVSSLERGFYLVQVITDKGKATHKVLVD